MKGSATTTSTADGKRQALGVAKTVDPAAGVITLERRPIKTIAWPATTVGFKATDAKLLAGTDRSPRHRAPCGAWRRPRPEYPLE